MKDRLRNIDIRDWAEKAKDRAVRAGLAMAVVGSMGLAGCQQSPEQRAAEVAAAVQTVLAEGTPTPDTISALVTQVVENPTLTPAPEETVHIEVAARTAEGKWELQNADGEKQEIALPEGFTPDARLRVHTQPDTFSQSLPLPEETAAFADFQEALNTKRADGTPPLVGYDPSIELGDYCSNPPDNQCTAQLNTYSWKVFTGEEVDVPGIGSLRGREGRAVALLLLNRDGTVHAWDGEAPVRVEHGFTGGGPIRDGHLNIDKTEQGLATHYTDRLLYGIPGMYRGACDNPDNCAEVLLVSAQRRQWGNNADGSPRFIFELLRAEITGK